MPLHRQRPESEEAIPGTPPKYCFSGEYLISQVTALVVLEDVSQVAVGFANGSVTVIRGDFIHDRGTKQRTVFESEDPVTALEVREGATTVLFIATVGRIVSLVISGKNSGQPAKMVDNRGCDVGCMTLDHDTRDLVVARTDAIYTYTTSGRGQPLAFEGPKKLVQMFKDYVAIVCLPRVSRIAKSRSSRRVGTTEPDDMFTSSSFTLLDTDLKYIAHAESISAQIKDVFVEWGELFLLTIEGKVSCLPGFDKLSLNGTGLSLPGEEPSTKTRDFISTQSLYLSHQPGTKVRCR